MHLERRSLSSKESLSKEVTGHLFRHYPRGRAIVITDNPTALRAVVGKHWQRIIRHLQRERSSTLNAQRIQELSKLISNAQRTHISTFALEKLDYVDILFATPEQMNVTKLTCETLYIINPKEGDHIRFGQAVNDDGTIVIYQQIIDKNR